MQHFPIFVKLSDKKVVVSGGGEAAVCKLRLLLKTTAEILVFAPSPTPQIVRFAQQQKLQLISRSLQAGDAKGATLVYVANEDTAEDARIAAIARGQCDLVNIVDNLQDSDFLTPAMVCRDPVTVAIGTEGAAPVLARVIKANLEEQLPVQIGLLAQMGKAFRKAANALPQGRKRRAFWTDYYLHAGPRALASQGTKAIPGVLADLLKTHGSKGALPGRVDIIDARINDPEHLTLMARRAIDAADVVIHDGDVSADILELARREALVISTSNSAPSLQHYAKSGMAVVRLWSQRAQSLADLAQDYVLVGVETRIIPGVTPHPVTPVLPVLPTPRLEALQ